MATWYSDVLHSTGVDGTAPTHGHQPRAGLQHYPIKTSRVTLGTSYLDNEVIVFQPVDPNDRLRSLLVTAGATFNASTTLTIDFGLYKLNPTTGELGAVIDLDVFASLVNIDATAIARVDLFGEATTLVNLDRMKRFWELAEIPVNLDPAQGRGETWAICGQLNVSGTVTGGGSMLMEAEIYKG